AAPWVRTGLSDPNQDLERDRESVKDGSGPRSRIRGMSSVLLLLSLSLTGVRKDGAAAGRPLPSSGLGDGEDGCLPEPAASCGCSTRAGGRASAWTSANTGGETTGCSAGSSTIKGTGTVSPSRILGYSSMKGSSACAACSGVAYRSSGSFRI